MDRRNQPIEKPLVVDSDRNLNMNRPNPYAGDMSNQPIETDRNLNMDRQTQYADDISNQPIEKPLMNSNRNVNMDRQTQADMSNQQKPFSYLDSNKRNPYVDSSSQSTMSTEPIVNPNESNFRERNQNLDDTSVSSTNPSGKLQQEGLGYNPALFPDGWDSQDPSTWSTGEKLKSKIPGTKEHKIKSDLNKSERNDENLNQQQTNQQSLNRDHMDQLNLNRDQMDQ